MLLEIIKLIGYSLSIVIVSKYILVITLRKIAKELNLSSKVIGNITGISTSVPEFLTVITSSIKGLSRYIYI